MHVLDFVGMAIVVLTFCAGIFYRGARLRNRILLATGVGVVGFAGLAVVAANDSNASLGAVSLAFLVLVVGLVAAAFLRNR
ncbi:MAG: hypothetical protein AB7E70_05170 [Hyphomicrobiaceae bacterium]